MLALSPVELRAVVGPEGVHQGNHACWIAEFVPGQDGRVLRKDLINVFVA